MQVKDFFDCLVKNKIEFFCGVPDSLLKPFCAYIQDNVTAEKNIITANEGNAIALASGHYLASGNPALVYMQNSGLGNCVNPLLSLTDDEVYNIPVLMLIGWRGEPGKKDEPQHIKQGKVTAGLLETMGIKYEILPVDFNKAQKSVSNAVNYMAETLKPYAFIVQNGTFEEYTLVNKVKNEFEMTREEAVSYITAHLKDDDVVVSTTGQISRELYEYREAQGQGHKKDFLTVGSMGHSSSIALGIALEKPEKRIFCFDGDGAALMHLGAVPVIGSLGVKNFKHIIFNNEAHVSVGAQPTCARKVDIPELFSSCGYKNFYSVKTKKELEQVLSLFLKVEGPAVLEVKVNTKARKDLGRPKEKPCENKELFMSFLSENKTFLGRNSLENLPSLLEANSAKRVLVFTGKKSFEPFRKEFDNFLKNIETVYYNDFSLNPKATEVDAAVSKTGDKFDMIIAVGGGSVIDFAKLYKFAVDNKVSVLKYFDEPFDNIINKTKLVAIPTTAGTGSEATKFAVLYIDGVKYSLENNAILPDYAIVDSRFLKDTPRYVKATCALDAYCQAIESFWSVNSTQTSLEYATEAILLARDYIEKFVNTDDDEAMGKMALASNLAGKAINISKTTAAHAISYTLTSKYDIPHGHAVALSIAKLCCFNADINVENVQDKRGAEFVKSQLKSLYELIGTDKPCEYFKNLFENIGIEYDLTKLGAVDTCYVVNSVDKARLSNNPKKLSEKELMAIFDIDR
ncbi:MAG: phosphonopyruvate decarboxylase [Candidatus Gastranaerophilales bacterium]|nr:phosphonopyruvate decarboxylase [Candidatus Gastranaerophilales bacterium]